MLPPSGAGCVADFEGLGRAVPQSPDLYLKTCSRQVGQAVRVDFEGLGMPQSPDLYLKACSRQVGQAV
jgi:hypothetical protein